MGKDGCCGGHCCDDENDDSCCEEMSVEDLTESNQIILSALIEVLQRKGVLTQDELDKEIEEIQSEDEDGEEEGDEETPVEGAASPW